jgi:hypothetical protein
MSNNNLVLILYYRTLLPSRRSLSDHLDAFRSIPGHRTIYFNLAFYRLPNYFANIRFSAVIFHYTLCGLRFNRVRFEKVLSRSHQVLVSLAGYKVAYPQDEFAHMDLLCNLINTYRIDHVFTVSPICELPKIYKTVDFGVVNFSRVLTGYISEESLRYVNKRLSRSSSRTLYFFYRAVVNPAWGAFNLLKDRLATHFEEYALRHGLPSDIKVGEKYLLSGNAWLDKLLASKFTFGCEGGASILDWNGSYCEYLSNKRLYGDVDNLKLPQYEEISIRALSPRHLEAALTKTCQVLVKGSYNDVLMPWKHYIPLNEDFSDFDLVVNAMNNNRLVSRIVNNSYRDIVLSGLYFYSSLIRLLLDKLNDLPRQDESLVNSRIITIAAFSASYLCNLFSDIFSYAYSLYKFVELKHGARNK